MKRYTLALCALIAAVSPALGTAQTYRISVSQIVEHPALNAVLKGFQDYLKENNILAEYQVHIAQGNMATATQIGNQIMGEKPDLILTISTPTSQACVQALKKSPQMQKTPLLFTAVTDPVEAGLVKSLEKPGGNITGVSDMLPVAEHLRMVKTFLPDLKKLGFMYNAGEVNSKILDLTTSIVSAQQITTLMVTHNMNHALTFGNRLIMLHRGKIIFDIQGEEKAALKKEDLIARFYDRQKEELSADRMLLG